MPAWYIKLTPLALLSLSSVTDKPSSMLGVLATSSGVKNHCSWRACDARCGLECAGDGALRRERGRGGEVLELYAGGDGTGGGTSRLRTGDLDERSAMGGGGFGGRAGRDGG